MRKTRIGAIALIAMAASAASHLTLRAEQTAAPRHPLSATRAVRAVRAARTAPRTVWDSVYSEEQAKRGETLYGDTCARCHQATLIGKDDALPLAGSAFLSGYDGLPLSTLFERINSSMPSDDPGSLTRQQIADVVAYLLRFNGFPAGQSELPREADPLKEIRFVAAKP